MALMRGGQHLKEFQEDTQRGNNFNDDFKAAERNTDVVWDQTTCKCLKLQLYSSLNIFQINQKLIFPKQTLYFAANIWILTEGS